MVQSRRQGGAANACSCIHQIDGNLRRQCTMPRSCLDKTYIMARYKELQFTGCLTRMTTKELTIQTFFFFFYILTDVNSSKYV